MSAKLILYIDGGGRWRVNRFSLSNVHFFSTSFQDPPRKSSYAPLECVWAKDKSFPWYPAVVVEPPTASAPVTAAAAAATATPSEAFFADLVPPSSVLEIKKEGHYLIRFFDKKLSW